MKRRILVAIPAFNESASLVSLLPDLLSTVRSTRTSSSVDFLLVDDGSNDDTAAVAHRNGIVVLRHSTRRGYGNALITAFHYAVRSQYDFVLTFDADGQHLPQDALAFLETDDAADVISGSRYLPGARKLTEPPAPEVNQLFASILNSICGLSLTDAGCGLKRISTRLLAALNLTEPEYGFPLEFWVQASGERASVTELPVTMLYLDPRRSFSIRFGSVGAAIERLSRVLLRALFDQRLCREENSRRLLNENLETMQAILEVGIKRGLPCEGAIEVMMSAKSLRAIL